MIHSEQSSWRYYARTTQPIRPNKTNLLGCISSPKLRAECTCLVSEFHPSHIAGCPSPSDRSLLNCTTCWQTAMAAPHGFKMYSVAFGYLNAWACVKCAAAVQGCVLPGRSEKSRMHSLKPLARSRSRSCCRIATPIQNGNEEMPSSSVSHRWKILCRGKTSTREAHTGQIARLAQSELKSRFIDWLTRASQSLTLTH